MDAIPEDVLKKTKLLVLNYPNSPTGALAPKAFFERVIRFAHEHNVVIINDAAHIMLTYQGKPTSFLEIDGAIDVGLEVHSLSKGFHMIGWRLGFFVGSPRIVRAVADVKDNCDSGQFMAIQKAGVAALANSAISEQVRGKYERRLKKLVNTLGDMGFKADMPGGTYFLYVPAPKGAVRTVGGKEERFTFQNAEDASQFLIREYSICTVPWDDCGPFLRFSVTYMAPEEAAEDALMSSLRERLAGCRLEF